MDINYDHVASFVLLLKYIVCVWNLALSLPKDSFVAMKLNYVKKFELDKID